MVGQVRDPGLHLGYRLWAILLVLIRKRGLDKRRCITFGKGYEPTKKYRLCVVWRMFSARSVRRLDL